MNFRSGCIGRENWISRLIDAIRRAFSIGRALKNVRQCQKAINDSSDPTGVCVGVGFASSTQLRFWISCDSADFRPFAQPVTFLNLLTSMRHRTKFSEKTTWFIEVSNVLETLINAHTNTIKTGKHPKNEQTDFYRRYQSMEAVHDKQHMRLLVNTFCGHFQNSFSRLFHRIFHFFRKFQRFAAILEFNRNFHLIHSIAAIFYLHLTN